MIYRFGLFEFDPAAGELRKQGRLVRIEPQPARALALLVANPGEVISRERLRAHLWDAGTHVDYDRGLAYCLGQVRTALGDTADNPRFVETLPRRGYRFIAPVQGGEVQGAAPTTTEPLTAHDDSTLHPVDGAVALARDSAQPSRPVAAAVTRGWLPLVVLGVLVTAGVAWTARARIAPARRRVAVAVFDNETGRPEFDRLAATAADIMVERLTALGTQRVGVIGNTPTLRVPRARRDPAAVQRETGAGYFVLGQVQENDAGVRLVVHLIRLDDDTHLWVTRVARAPADLSDIPEHRGRPSGRGRPTARDRTRSGRMDRILATLKTMWAHYLEAVGPYVQLVYLTDDLGSQNSLLISPRMFRQLLKPRMKELHDHIKSLADVKVMFHSDGAVLPLLDDFIDMNVDILNPVQTSVAGLQDTFALKEKYGDRLCFHGEIDVQQMMPNATPEELEREIARRIYDLGRGGGYILAPCHNLGHDIPPRNIVALFERAREAPVQQLPRRWPSSARPPRGALPSMHGPPGRRRPPTHLGIPLVYRYRQPGLGVTGDLMLCDFSAYLIKDGSGPFVGMSDAPYYLNNKTVIKAFWNVDGSPWLTESIIPSTQNSTAVASPFVVLSS